MAKYLIVNADDFGMCHSANLAIQELLDTGCIHSTTLIACAPWAHEAAAMARQNPRIKMGVHLTHTSEWDSYRWRPISDQVPSLKDAEGCFYHWTKDCLAHADPAELMKEARAQVEWVQRQGLKVSHLDNHMFTLQRCISEVLDLCHELHASYRMDRAASRIAEPLLEEYRELIRKADRLAVPITDYLNPNSDRFPSDRETYASAKESYIQMLRHLPEGTTEIFTHPAVESDELKAIAPDWKVRVADYQFLKDPDFHRILKEEQITLIGWDAEDILLENSALRNAG